MGFFLDMTIYISTLLKSFLVLFLVILLHIISVFSCEKFFTVTTSSVSFRLLYKV